MFEWNHCDNRLNVISLPVWYLRKVKRSHMVPKCAQITHLKVLAGQIRFKISMQQFRLNHFHDGLLSDSLNCINLCLH